MTNFITLSVPHRGDADATVWTDREDFIDAAREDSGDYDLETFEAAERHFSDDVSFFCVIEGEEAAKELYEMLVKNRPHFGKCGPIVAASALERAAKSEGWTVV